MTDIVERLRAKMVMVFKPIGDTGAVTSSLEPEPDAKEAADEIERLREVLRFYANEKNWSEKIRSSSMGEYEASNVELDQGSYARSSINPR